MNSSSNLRPTAPDVASRNPPTRYCSPKRGAVDLKLDRPAWLPGKAHRLDDPTGTGDRPAGPTVGRSSEHLLVGETVGAHSTGEAVWGPGRRPETSPTRATNSAPPVLRCGPPSRCAGATSSHPRPDCPHFSPVVEFRLFYEISLLARPLYQACLPVPSTTPPSVALCFPPSLFAKELTEIWAHVSEHSQVIHPSPVAADTALHQTTSSTPQRRPS